MVSRTPSHVIDTWVLTNHVILGTPYDCQSVMHYAKDQMTKNGQDTIQPLDPVNCQLPSTSEWNFVTPWMSNLDVQAVQQQYGEFC